MTSKNDHLAFEIERLGPWFHNLVLDGIETAPNHYLGNYPATKWQRFAHSIPERLDGLSILDIGCNAGFYAQEMKRRGAARVLGIDFDPTYLAQARFAAKINQLDIEFRELSVYQLKRLHETFDLVLFMGVLYHLRHPLLALDLIRDYAAKDMLIMQTLQRGSPNCAEVNQNYSFDERSHFDHSGYPKLHFVEHYYANDPTNWWFPNRACTKAMLRSAGFKILNNPDPEVFICRIAEKPTHYGPPHFPQDDLHD